MAVLRIDKPDLFSFQQCLWFLDRNLDDCLHPLEGSTVSRALLIEGKQVGLTVSEKADQLLIHIDDENYSEAMAPVVIRYVEDWFDLRRDIAPFYRLLEQHPEFGYMAEEYAGLRTMHIPDVFESLVWSIIGQQINLTFAYKLKRALVEKYGTTIKSRGRLLMTFPEPTVLAALEADDLKALQFSRQKAAYIINAAQVFASGQLSKAILLEMSSGERIRMLTSLKGVGIWTANYVLMKSLSDPTGLPLGDVGLLKALENHRLIADRKDQASVQAVFNDFTGWQSYLVHYLWRSLSVPAVTSNDDR